MWRRSYDWMQLMPQSRPRDLLLFRTTPSLHLEVPRPHLSSCFSYSRCFLRKRQLSSFYTTKLWLRCYFTCSFSSKTRNQLQLNSPVPVAWRSPQIHIKVKKQKKETGPSLYLAIGFFLRAKNWCSVVNRCPFIWSVLSVVMSRWQQSSRSLRFMKHAPINATHIWSMVRATDSKQCSGTSSCSLRIQNWFMYVTLALPRYYWDFMLLSLNLMHSTFSMGNPSGPFQTTPFYRSCLGYVAYNPVRAHSENIFYVIIRVIYRSWFKQAWPWFGALLLSKPSQQSLRPFTSDICQSTSQSSVIAFERLSSGMIPSKIMGQQLQLKRSNRASIRCYFLLIA